MRCSWSPSLRGRRGHDVDGVRAPSASPISAGDVPSPRIAAASSSLTRPWANFLRDGVASFGHHVARPIRSVFTSSGRSLTTVEPNTAASDYFDDGHLEASRVLPATTWFTRETHAKDAPAYEHMTRSQRRQQRSRCCGCHARNDHIPAAFRCMARTLPATDPAASTLIRSGSCRACDRL